MDKHNVAFNCSQKGEGASAQVCTLIGMVYMVQLNDPVAIRVIQITVPLTTSKIELKFIAVLLHLYYC